MRGAIWVYQADITNGAGGAGSHTYTLTPGVGNEIEILQGEVFNGDSSSRVISSLVDDGANRLYPIQNDLTIGAAGRYAMPVGESMAANRNSVGYSKYALAGTMRLVVTVASVAASQDSALGLVARIWGGVPDMVEAGASTPTININTERVF